VIRPRTRLPAEPVPPGAVRRMELHGMVGVSAPMQEVYDRVLRFARSTVPLMVVGETGTGKEMVAQAVHRVSGEEAPFVAVNCAALPEALVESELFGHERGAFTGAHTRRDGLLAQADGGILFLDEVGELPPAAQAKLLRVLEAGEYRAVGATRETRARFRLVAATNRDLDAMVAAGRFRPDLLHRLGTARIALPALRDRREDIPLLAEHFVKMHARRLRIADADLPRSVLPVLAAYPWPGNVRELENVLERALVLSGGRITEEAFPTHVRSGKELFEVRDDEGDLSVKRRLPALERTLISRALERCGGNRTRAAEILELSVRALSYKIQDYGLD